MVFWLKYFYVSITFFFQELEFERGIWSAAMDGEQKKVEKLLKGGVCPSATDSSGYTALVRSY